VTGDRARPGRLPRRVWSRLRRVVSSAPAIEPAGAADRAELEKLPRDARLLLESPLFDADWYSREVGRPLGRRAAVTHYLRTGAARGLSPHPLFQPDHFAERLGRDLGERDPFVVYVRRQAWGTPTHPLFDVQRYLKAVPEARERPGGPLGHYAEHGPADGFAGHPWLTDDLLSWVRARRDEWQQRDARRTRRWRTAYDESAGADVVARHADGPTRTPAVSVVALAGFDADAWADTEASLAAQTLPPSEVVTVDGGVGDPRAVAAAVARTTGDLVAFAWAGDTWPADRLRLLAAVAETESAEAVADVLHVTRPTGEAWADHGLPAGELADRGVVDPARLLVAGDLIRDGLPGSGRPGGWEADLSVLLARRTTLHTVPVVGVERDGRRHQEARAQPRDRRPLVEHAHLDTWTDVVLNETLVDWDELAGREQQAGLVTVVIPTYSDATMTVAAVRAVLETDTGGPEVECVVWDNGSPAAVSVVLDALPLRHPGVRVLHSPVNHGFALGNNLAVPAARGDVVVFLNNDTTVHDGWLAPLVASLDDPEVLAAQSLLLYPTGSIQSAGVAFPGHGGIPYSLLAGFPEEDAAGISRLSFCALTGAAVALRFDDVVALHGFDPVFRNGMEDIDLCLRLRELRPGRFVVRDDSRVTHHESRTPGRFDAFVQNRVLYLDRWEGRAPRDDAELWAASGFTVVGHRLRAGETSRRALAVPEPTLVRTDRLPGRATVTEAPPRLRWAIKNPASAGPLGDLWGDTHFAQAVARALRALGQEVVVDRRPEFDRATGCHDDVALVLRGLTSYPVTPEHVTIAWVISHPETVGRVEATSYDRVVAASVSWAERRSADWGIRVEPLLQATDPDLFHPDRAVPDTGHPVLFVGSSRMDYRPVVREAVEQGLPLSIYGRDWRQFVPRRFVKGDYLPNIELGAAYRSAGVVLNDHWGEMRRQGFVSNRIFDAVASGARVVTDEVTGVADLFGDTVQVWRTPEDLTRLSSLVDPDAVFGDDDHRRSVAQRVAREHSFAARAERLVQIAVEARHERGFRD
jgi:GT2 family glycosyltransferase